MNDGMRIAPQDIVPGTYVYVVDPGHPMIPAGAFVMVDSTATHDGYATVVWNGGKFRIGVSWFCRALTGLEQLAAAAQD